MSFLGRPDERPSRQLVRPTQPRQRAGVTWPTSTATGGPKAVVGEVNILGCVEIAGRNGRLELPSSRQRCLVAALALQPGTVVPTWRLVEALWGEHPPRTAVRSLHSHVARLRLGLAACGLGDMVQTREPGYLLAADPHMVDAWRFEQEAQAGRACLGSGLTDAAAEALAKSLTLWRGVALADAEPTGWTAAQANRLDELRQAVTEDRCEALLALGRHSEALVELERLMAADSARERLVGLHMIALSRYGRVAESLAAFQRLRRRLAHELGVDPSPELGELHTALLRGVTGADLRAPGSALGRRAAETVIVTRPAQLPARVGYFTGRSEELQRLESALGTADRPERPVVLIYGQGGIGKTALAVEFCHRIADRFPGGQVFVDVRGNDRATALTAEEIIAVLLRCLGVPGDRLPTELGERVGLYRSLLAGKRVLIVLDNVETTSQVSAAIPSAAGSMLVVTSRSNLASLATHAEVCPVVLDVLTTAEAWELLTRMLGAGRVAREPAAAVELAAVCARLPMALRLAAAKLVMQPLLSIGRLVDDLSGHDRPLRSASKAARRG
jgi:DNA-binding SARP family transcriptional activator